MRLLVDAKGAADICGVSIRQWWRLDCAQKTPPGVFLGHRTKRWRVEEIRAWVCAGCPNRVAWKISKGGA